MPIVKLPTGPKLAMSTMAIIRVGGDYADADFALLGRHLKLLDIEICRINAAIVSSRDPESDGLCDAGEYFIGHGFIAIQRYLTATRTGLGISLIDALKVPPILRGGLSLAAALNAAANYWKHMEEWIEALNGLDGGTLKGNALRTLQQIEAVTPWEDYTCANLLAVLLDGRALELSNLLPSIAEWRDNLINTPLVNSGGGMPQSSEWQHQRTSTLSRISKSPSAQKMTWTGPGERLSQVHS